MGDFNFHSTWEEQAKITSNGYIDLYLEMNNGREDFSMLKTKQFSEWRPDKIIVPSTGNKWKATDIKIVGKFSIPRFSKENIFETCQDSIIRTPSDHMSIITTFEYKGK